MDFFTIIAASLLVLVSAQEQFSPLPNWGNLRDELAAKPPQNPSPNSISDSVPLLELSTPASKPSWTEKDARKVHQKVDKIYELIRMAASGVKAGTVSENELEATIGQIKVLRKKVDKKIKKSVSHLLDAAATRS
jgi:hypothetical protein